MNIMDREEALNVLENGEYFGLRILFDECKSQPYDEDIANLLKRYPLFCFEFEVLTHIDFLPSKFHHICYLPPGIKSFTNLRILALDFNLLTSLP